MLIHLFVCFFIVMMTLDYFYPVIPMNKQHLWHDAADWLRTCMKAIKCRHLDMP